MNFPFYIAKRYLFSKSSNNTINIITSIATVGVIIGTMALFIVLSGFSGLRTFSVGFLNTSDPDLKISAVKGKSFELTADQMQILKTDPKIYSYSKVIEERAFFEFNKKTHVAFIKGVDKNYPLVTKIDTTVYVGTWLLPNLPNGVVVGNGIADILSVGVFDFLEPLKIYVPKPGEGYIKSPTNAFSLVNTQPVGVFGLTDDIDKKYVFVPLPLAQELLSYKSNQISAIEIKVDNLSERETIISSLQSKFGNNFKIETREQLNSVFYKMLNTENLASYLIFTLIVVIALFNVIGAIIMMILDKRNNLKTLYNLGATVKEIKLIFILQGFLLTIFGLLIGLTLGILLVLAQLNYKMFMISQHLAYPVELTVKNIIVVVFTILVLGLLASQIASGRISKKLFE